MFKREISVSLKIVLLTAEKAVSFNWKINYGLFKTKLV
jgi:hypothetical protein